MLRIFLVRLISQTVVLATGFLGLLIAVVRDFWFPDVNPLPYYLALLVLSIIIGSFKVYTDLQREYEIAKQEQENQIRILKLQLDELKNNQPLLEVGFDGGDENCNDKLLIMLNNNKPSYDLGDLLDNKRKTLLKKFPEKPRNDNFLVAQNPLAGVPISKGIDRYIGRLRTYHEELEKWYFYHNKGFLIYPVIKNNGTVTANTIIVEFVLPEIYVIRDQKLRDEANWTLTDEESKPVEPREPDLHDLLHSSRDWFLTNTGMALESAFKDTLPAIENHGPIYSFIDGKAVITYNYPKLVHGRATSELDPFLIWFGDTQAPPLIKIQANIFAEELKSVPKTMDLYLEILVESKLGE